MTKLGLSFVHCHAESDPVLAFLKTQAPVRHFSDKILVATDFELLQPAVAVVICRRL